MATSRGKGPRRPTEDAPDDPDRLEGEVVGEGRPPEPSTGEPITIEPITIEIDRQLERLEDFLEKLQEEVAHWAKKGVHTKVRFKLRGKPLLPDIPVAAFLAAEAATFWWGGLLRAIAVNFGGRALLDVEFISDAEPHLARGKEHLLDGDLDEALDCFQTALAIARDMPSIHLNLGIVHKLKGDREAAAAAFRQAHKLDPHGEIGRQAMVQLKKLGRS
jgi:tetratricopeptide (TPR) repeat protein